MIKLFRNKPNQLQMVMYYLHWVILCPNQLLNGKYLWKYLYNTVLK